MRKTLKNFPFKKLGIGFFYFLIFIALISSLINLFINSYNFFAMSSWKAAEWIGFSQLIVYIIAALIAAITIYTNVKSSKERATLDMILNDHNDHSFQKSKRIVFEFARKVQNDPKAINDITNLFLSPNIPSKPTNKNFFKLKQDIKIDNEDLTDLKDAFLLVMNRHEFYAAGINSGLLDENIFKRANCNTFIKIWDAFSTTVLAIRKKEGKDTIFKELEILAIKWKMNPLTEKDIGK